MRPWLLSALLGFTMLTVGCAKPPPTSSAAPRLALAAEAKTPCALHILPEQPTLADLEIGYVTRGAQIVACDAARRLAVETYAAQQALTLADQAAR
ncbi:hypothetical protein [Phenylobacterium sp.]|uniref:hypothetical protein n=1 Tax=Phenylobacterium sp. TaxID=1871053 RepID=UPI0025D94505|nr:hypothetical protein [Phenylobacterium sp.]|tara:strand:- start:2262 stop:2549 length:288 start_codon:yes stop_codon:yes gene_type:complete